MPFMPRDDPELRPDAIRAAKVRIAPVFVDSPQYVNETLSARAGRTVVVKIETANPIGSFKGRGTWLAVHELAGEGRIGRDRPLVVASTGNFGQGAAYAGRSAGVPVVVFADESANPRKMERIRRFGATVIIAGHDFDAAREASAAWAEEHGGGLLVDGEEPWVATGPATLALEVTEGIGPGRLPAIGAAYVPVGNGALIIGVGAWLRHAAPECRVIGVQSDAAPAMALSWWEGRVVETESAATVAEGIATRVPVPEALDMMAGRVDELRLVPEGILAAATAELAEATGVTAEASAAVSWAAVLADPDPPPGAALVLVTGANVAPRP